MKVVIQPCFILCTHAFGVDSPETDCSNQRFVRLSLLVPVLFLLSRVLRYQHAVEYC